MKVLLIGDSCTDVYVYGDVKRLNPEAPVPILEPKREEKTNGMAWNVYNNLLAFDTEVYLLTNQEKITKTRYIDEKSNQQILRLDVEEEVKQLDYEMKEETYNALRVTRHKYDCVIRSRYDLGTDIDIDLNKLDLNKINISNHHWGGSPITDDNLCILNQDNAEKLFSDIFTEYIEHSKKIGYIEFAEKNFMNILKRKNLYELVHKSDDLPFQLLRDNKLWY